MKEIAWPSRAAAIERAKNFRHKEIMLQDGLTAAQRLAIQKLIRAKSDREIARLLRKSYHLLNPHRRPFKCFAPRKMGRLRTPSRWPHPG